MTEIQIVNITPDHTEQLQELQRTCFPTLADHELMNVEHFLNHCRLFPEGNFVALSGEQVVGLGSGFLMDFDFDHPNHTFSEIISDGFYTNHDPDGDYYYGADISVHPEFRKLGIGNQLYDARKGIVKTLNRKGIVAGGVLPGYPNHRNKLSIHTYVEQVVAGKLYDPTLSFQLRNGFEVRGMLENYIEDSASDNWSTLIVWDNPNYTPV